MKADTSRSLGAKTMSETRRRFDSEFRRGAVDLVRQNAPPIAPVARELAINGTLDAWVDKDRKAPGGDGGAGLNESEHAELIRLSKAVT
jgi:transposase